MKVAHNRSKSKRGQSTILDKTVILEVLPLKCPLLKSGVSAYLPEKGCPSNPDWG